MQLRHIDDFDDDGGGDCAVDESQWMLDSTREEAVLNDHFGCGARTMGVIVNSWYVEDHRTMRVFWSERMGR